MHKQAFIFSLVAAFVLSGLWGCDNQDAQEGSSSSGGPSIHGTTEQEQPSFSVEPRQVKEHTVPADQATAVAADEICNDLSKLEAWKEATRGQYDSFLQRDLDTLSKKNPSPETSTNFDQIALGYIRYAKRATDAAVAVITNHTDSTQWRKVIAKAAECALLCDQASGRYKRYAPADMRAKLQQLAQCDQSRNHLLKNPAQLEDTQELIRLLYESMHPVLERMMRKGFTVRDSTSGQDITVQYYGPTAIAIAQEAERLFTEKVITKKADERLEVKCDLNTPAGQQAFSSHIARVVILLIEALKHHYEESEIVPVAAFLAHSATLDYVSTR